MAIRLKLKHSATANKAPLPSDLEAGELALNTNAASPAAYIKDSAGNIVKLAGSGSIGGVDATTTVKGVVTLADAAAITAGTAGRVVTADQLKTTNDAIATAAGGGISGLTGTAPVTVTGPNTAKVVAIADATEAAAGIVELATAAETTTGTDATRAVHPAGLKVELDKKAPLDSPALIGVPTAPTAAAGTNTTQLATTAFVHAATPTATASVAGVDVKLWKKTGTTLETETAGDTVSASTFRATTGAGWTGTVSQAGSSAVIERGTNANGEYIRYADGTQICWTSGGYAWATGPGTVNTLTFPIAFSANPATVTSPVCSDAADASVNATTISSIVGVADPKSQVLIVIQNPGTRGSVGSKNVHLGRWY